MALRTGEPKHTLGQGSFWRTREEARGGAIDVVRSLVAGNQGRGGQVSGCEAFISAGGPRGLIGAAVPSLQEPSVDNQKIVQFMLNEETERTRLPLSVANLTNASLSTNTSENQRRGTRGNEFVRTRLRTRPLIGRGSG